MNDSAGGHMSEKLDDPLFTTKTTDEEIEAFFADSEKVCTVYVFLAPIIPHAT